MSIKFCSIHHLVFAPSCLLLSAEDRVSALLRRLLPFWMFRAEQEVLRSELNTKQEALSREKEALKRRQEERELLQRHKEALKRRQEERELLQLKNRSVA